MLMIPAVAQGSIEQAANHSILAALSNMLCCGCRTYLGWQNPSRSLYGTDSATPRAVLATCMAVSKALGPPIRALSVVTRAAWRSATSAQAKPADQRGEFLQHRCLQRSIFAIEFRCSCWGTLLSRWNLAAPGGNAVQTSVKLSRHKQSQAICETASLNSSTHACMLLTDL